MTPYNAAKSFAAQLRKKYKGEGSEAEIVVWSAAQTRERVYSSAPSVCWEAGPYQWAIHASLEDSTQLAAWRAAGVWTEPYNGFILSFFKL